MKKWFALWPCLGLPLMWLLNIDLGIIPYLQMHGLGFLHTSIIACILATGELVYVYWLIGWIDGFVKKIAKKKIAEKSIREDINFLKKFWNKLKRNGYYDEIVGYFSKKYNPEQYANLRIFKAIKWGGYPAIFLVGIFPEPGSRIGGTLVCRISGWRKGFFVLLVGNIVKTVGMVRFWQYIFQISTELRIIIITAMATIIVLLYFFSKFKRTATK